jgi:hypothetical protein
MGIVRVSFSLVKHFAKANRDGALKRRSRQRQPTVTAFVTSRSSSRGFFGAIERDGDYDSSAVLKSPRDRPC